MEIEQTLMFNTRIFACLPNILICNPEALAKPTFIYGYYACAPLGGSQFSTNTSSKVLQARMEHSSTRLSNVGNTSYFSFSDLCSEMHLAAKALARHYRREEGTIEKTNQS
jgi:hypothetical protein